MDIKAIIGLGNPGSKYHHTRHNIGFRIVDALCKKYGGSWQTQNLMDIATITIDGHKVLLIKPQTFMNASGKVLPFLSKQGIKAENVVVVHDELELPFGTVKVKVGGSAKGHNGLKSIIEHWGQDFARVRFGIGRPENRDDVSNYVLQNFAEEILDIESYIEQALELIGDLFD